MDNRYVALFAGVGPVESPCYGTVVGSDEPEGDVYGGAAAAAPVYSRITQEVLRIQNVVPNSAEPLSNGRRLAASRKGDSRA